MASTSMHLDGRSQTSMQPRGAGHTSVGAQARLIVGHMAGVCSACFVEEETLLCGTLGREGPRCTGRRARTQRACPSGTQSWPSSQPAPTHNRREQTDLQVSRYTSGQGYACRCSDTTHDIPTRGWSPRQRCADAPLRGSGLHAAPPSSKGGTEGPLEAGGEKIPEGAVHAMGIRGDVSELLRCRVRNPGVLGFEINAGAWG
jgi:hypothetical protein